MKKSEYRCPAEFKDLVSVQTDLCALLKQLIKKLPTSSYPHNIPEPALPKPVLPKPALPTHQKKSRIPVPTKAPKGMPSTTISIKSSSSLFPSSSLPQPSSSPFLPSSSSDIKPSPPSSSDVESSVSATTAIAGRLPLSYRSAPC